MLSPYMLIIIGKAQEGTYVLLNWLISSAASLFASQTTKKSSCTRVNKQFEKLSIKFIFKIFLCSRFVVAPAFFIECVRQQRGIVFAAKIRI